MTCTMAPDGGQQKFCKTCQTSGTSIRTGLPSGGLHSSGPETTIRIDVLAVGD